MLLTQLLLEEAQMAAEAEVVVAPVSRTASSMQNEVMLLA